MSERTKARLRRVLSGEESNKGEACRPGRPARCSSFFRLRVCCIPQSYARLATSWLGCGAFKSWQWAFCPTRLFSWPLYYMEYRGSSLRKASARRPSKRWFILELGSIPSGAGATIFSRSLAVCLWTSRLPTFPASN